MSIKTKKILFLWNIDFLNELMAYSNEAQRLMFEYIIPKKTPEQLEKEKEEQKKLEQEKQKKINGEIGTLKIKLDGIKLKFLFFQQKWQIQYY